MTFYFQHPAGVLSVVSLFPMWKETEEPGACALLGWEQQATWVIIIVIIKYPTSNSLSLIINNGYSKSLINIPFIETFINTPPSPKLENRGCGVAWFSGIQDSGFAARIILSGLGLKQKTRRPRFKGACVQVLNIRAAPYIKMAKKKLGSVKRFGPRYGTTVKIRLAKVEHEQKKLHKCPYCNAKKVKRVALGIWQCKKCKAKFTGKAYTISSKKVREEPKKAGVESGWVYMF